MPSKSARIVVAVAAAVAAVARVPAARPSVAGRKRKSAAASKRRAIAAPPAATPSADAQRYYCYLIHSKQFNRTYVGVTNDLKRRLRQHNGEISGGARSTRACAPTWRMVLYLEGFRSKQEALQFEWAWHNASRKSRGGGSGDVIQRRLRTLREVMRRERWTSNAPLSSSVPLAPRFKGRYARVKAYTSFNA